MLIQAALTLNGATQTYIGQLVLEGDVQFIINITEKNSAILEMVRSPMYACLKRLGHAIVSKYASMLDKNVSNLYVVCM